MPELPEVEAARRAIEENCLGKKIVKSIIADDSKVIDGVSASEFEASLSGKTIVAAHRKGKNLWLQLDSPPFPSFQFGMTGAVYIKGVAVTKYKRSAVKDDEEWPSKYSKVFIQLDDELEFSFTDKRRFAKVRLLKDPASVPPISELGPDAFLEPMTEEEFVGSLSKKKIAIKALLLDQSYISGIGNWVADELLYQAKIHPLQVAASLSKESCATLQKCIKEVIEKAVEVGADSSQYPTYWIFHTREEKPSKAFVDGKKVEFITAGGRTTAFVPELQKLSGNQAAKAVGKQSKQTNRKKGHQDESDDEDDESDGGDVAAKAKGKKEKKPRGQAKKKLPAKRKSEESDDGTDEEDDVAENTKLKKGTKAKGQFKKVPAKRKSRESDDEKNDDASDENNIAEYTKPKKGTQAKGQVKKNPTAKRKSKESDNEENDDSTGEDNVTEDTKPKKEMKSKAQAKKNPPPKRKSKGSDDEDNDDGTDEDGNVQKKRSKTVTDDKPSKAGKTTKRKAQPSQTSRSVKKKYK